MILIPMAGESRRFRTAGYDRPKYMLPLEGRPLFDWTVLSFRRYFQTESFLFVARDVDGTPDFLRERLTALGVRNFEVVILNHTTAGQAETVEYGLRNNPDALAQPLTIFNIDTIRPAFSYPTSPEVAGADGWLEVFKGEGEGWSFVEPLSPDSPYVGRTTEKVRISDLCSTGLYVFKTGALFMDALAKERMKPSSHELFVAPLYNHVVSGGGRVAYQTIGENEVIFSGIPAEYEALKTIRLGDYFQ